MPDTITDTIDEASSHKTTQAAEPQASAADPEVSTGTSENDAKTGSDSDVPRWIPKLVDATDSRFRIPGTSIRFGWDAVLGMIPGVGDLVGMVLGGAIVFAAWRLHASKATLAKMLSNLTLDAVLGAVPVVGDFFDVTFKANSRNLDLLQDELETRRAA